MCSRPSGRLRKDEKDKARRWPRQRSREELHSRFQQQQIPAAQTVANHWGGGGGEVAHTRFSKFLLELVNMYLPIL